jgi:hypothetical protein
VHACAVGIGAPREDIRLTAKASVRLAATPLELRLINCHFDRRENLVINNDAFDCLDLRFLAPLEMTTCSELP